MTASFVRILLPIFFGWCFNFKAYEAFLTQIVIVLVSLFKPIPFFLQWWANITVKGGLRHLLGRIFGIRLLVCYFSDFKQVQMLQVIFHRTRSHIQQRHILLWRTCQTIHTLAISRTLALIVLVNINLVKLSRFIAQRLSAVLASFSFPKVYWDGGDYWFVDIEVVSWFLPPFLPQFIELSYLHESF